MKKEYKGKSIICPDCGITIEDIPNSMTKEKALSEHKQLDCGKGKVMQKIFKGK